MPNHPRQTPASLQRCNDGSSIWRRCEYRGVTKAALTEYREHLEELVQKRTGEGHKTILLMSGREAQMSELKEIIQRLQNQIREAGLTPIAEDTQASRSKKDPHKTT